MKRATPKPNRIGLRLDYCRNQAAGNPSNLRVSGIEAVPVVPPNYLAVPGGLMKRRLLHG